MNNEKKSKQTGKCESEIKSANTNIFKREAKKYLALGWSVIPVRPQKKIPYVKWKQYQTKLPTENEIKTGGEQYPDAQIGVVTGVTSNLTVIDFDSLEAIDQFRTNIGELPQTIYQVTGRGAHALFKRAANFVLSLMISQHCPNL